MPIPSGFELNGGYDNDRTFTMPTGGTGGGFSEFLAKLKKMMEEQQLQKKYEEKSASKTRKRKEAFEEESQDLPPNWDSMPDWLKKAWERLRFGDRGGNGNGETPWTASTGVNTMLDLYGGLTGGNGSAWSGLGGLLGGWFG